MRQAIEKEKRLRLSKLEEQDKALRYGLVRWVDGPNGDGQSLNASVVANGIARV
jgi:hypothetical protein